MKLRSLWLLLFLPAFLFGCSSGVVRISSPPLENQQKLGRTEGKACGSMGVFSTAYYVVPMGVNSRYQRAYANALAGVPGATGLTDVTFREDWFWWVVGTARCVTITGEAIK